MRTGLIAIALLLVLGGVYYFQSDAPEPAPGDDVPITVTPAPGDGTDETTDTEPADESGADGVGADADTDTADGDVGSVTVVTYDGTSFSPERVTVSVGDTVRFQSAGGADMWVASNVHPTHREYPVTTGSDCLGSAFDQCAVGETFEFAFTAPGTHEYHNHVRARHGGTIVVE